MSFTDRLILWLHIGVAIFTIGPVTAAIMSTPRYIRKRDAVVVGYLQRITQVYAIASLLVLVFGIVLADLRNDFSKPWISISMTLFVVALVLLVLIIRDQRAAAAALRREAVATAPQPPAVVQTEGAAAAEGKDETAADADAEPTRTDTPAPAADSRTDPVKEAERIAAVERGRIASLGGVTALIWLVILVLMVWR